MKLNFDNKKLYKEFATDIQGFSNILELADKNLVSDHGNNISDILGGIVVGGKYEMLNGTILDVKEACTEIQAVSSAVKAYLAESSDENCANLVRTLNTAERMNGLGECIGSLMAALKDFPEASEFDNLKLKLFGLRRVSDSINMFTDNMMYKQTVHVFNVERQEIKKMDEEYLSDIGRMAENMFGLPRELNLVDVEEGKYRVTKEKKEAEEEHGDFENGGRERAEKAAMKAKYDVEDSMEKMDICKAKIKTAKDIDEQLVSILADLEKTATEYKTDQDKSEQLKEEKIKYTKESERLACEISNLEKEIKEYDDKSKKYKDEIDKYKVFAEGAEHAIGIAKFLDGQIKIKGNIFNKALYTKYGVEGEDDEVNEEAVSAVRNLIQARIMGGTTKNKMYETAEKEIKKVCPVMFPYINAVMNAFPLYSDAKKSSTLSSDELLPILQIRDAESLSGAIFSLTSLGQVKYKEELIEKDNLAEIINNYDVINESRNDLEKARENKNIADNKVNDCDMRINGNALYHKNKRLKVISNIKGMLAEAGNLDFASNEDCITYFGELIKMAENAQTPEEMYHGIHDVSQYFKELVNSEIVRNKKTYSEEELSFYKNIRIRDAAKKEKLEKHAKNLLERKVSTQKNYDRYMKALEIRDKASMNRNSRIVRGNDFLREVRKMRENLDFDSAAGIKQRMQRYEEGLYDIQKGSEDTAEFSEMANAIKAVKEAQTKEEVMARVKAAGDAARRYKTAKENQWFTFFRRSDVRKFRLDMAESIINFAKEIAAANKNVDGTAEKEFFDNESKINLIDRHKGKNQLKWDVAQEINDKVHERCVNMRRINREEIFDSIPVKEDVMAGTETISTVQKEKEKKTN